MKVKNIYVYLIYVLAVTLVVTGISLSRFSVTYTNNDADKIGATVPIESFDIQMLSYPTNPTEYTEEYPGKTPYSEYKFVIKNRNENKVPIKAKINISWTDNVDGGDIPLTYELYEEYTYVENVGGVPTEKVTTTKIYPTAVGRSVVPANINEFDVPVASFKGGESKTFTLKWIWGSTDAHKKSVYAKKNIDVNISVDAMQ